MKKIMFNPEPIMSREQLIGKAFQYAKQTGVSIAEACRLNGLIPKIFYSWLLNYGVPWKRQEQKELTQEKVEYCKNNRDKTLLEICKEKRWDYANIKKMLINHDYSHPHSESLKFKRKIPIIRKLLKKGHSLSFVSKKTKTWFPIVQEIKHEMEMLI